MGSIRRVRAGSKYTFQPVLLDQINPPYGVRAGFLKEGDVVQVVNLQGCPPANTMGHVGIEKDGEFAGLVCCNSLIPLSKKRRA